VHDERARGLRELACVRRAATLVQNADGTVTDNNTGLTWMSAPAGEVDGGTEIYATSFAAAEAACPCPWRLPQRIELASIVDYSRYYMALNPLFFTNAADGNTAWTATTFVATSTWWFVDFVEGSPTGPDLGDVAGQVRCVPGTPHPPAERHTLQTSDAGVAEVVDNGTGLTWKQQSEPGMLGWDAAFAQSTAPYRMPTISELSTLVDSSRSEPAIDITVFSDTGSSWYLTSSAVAYAYLGGNYWYIDFTTGSATFLSNVAGLDEARDLAAPRHRALLQSARRKPGIAPSATDEMTIDGQRSSRIRLTLRNK
jgi:hypothetical protein